MAAVKLRKCDACLCTESKDDPRCPWYVVSFVEGGRTYTELDVCGRCHVKPLLTLRNEILDNIKEGDTSPN